MSETAKYRHLTVPYCVGNGVDLGSQGNPVVPWAISVDLPESEFSTYNAGNHPEHSVHWRGDALKLPFKDGTLDFVYSSHLLEDFADWTPALTEWIRVLKKGGKLIILMPDRERWAEALRRGQPPNCAHRKEGEVGALTAATRRAVRVIEDRLTNLTPEDYSILFVGERL